MDVSTIYWLTRLPEIKEAVPGIGLALLLFLLFIVYIILSMVKVDAAKDKEMGKYLDLITHFTKISKNFFIVMLSVFIISNVLNVFIPKERDLAIILAGSWATNSEEMQKLPNNVVKVINDLLNKHSSIDSEEKTK